MKRFNKTTVFYVTAWFVDNAEEIEVEFNNASEALDYYFGHIEYCDDIVIAAFDRKNQTYWEYDARQDVWE